MKLSCLRMQNAEPDRYKQRVDVLDHDPHRVPKMPSRVHVELNSTGVQNTENRYGLKIVWVHAGCTR